MHISKKAARRGCIVLLSRSYVLILNIPRVPESSVLGCLVLNQKVKFYLDPSLFYRIATWTKEIIIPLTLAKEMGICIRATGSTHFAVKSK